MLRVGLGLPVQDLGFFVTETRPKPISGIGS